MKRHYIDAMTLVQRFGKPDIILTITCNPCWPEIKLQLGDSDLAQDRPDLVSRIIRAELEYLKKDLIKFVFLGRWLGIYMLLNFRKEASPTLIFCLS